MMELINPDDIPFVEAPIAPVLNYEEVHYESITFKTTINKMPRIEAVPANLIQDAMMEIRSAESGMKSQFGDYEITGGMIFGMSEALRILNKHIREVL